MSKPFKLSAALYGHSLDVRSVAVTSTNSIISGSRDKTAKLWIPNGFNAGFSESVTYRDQKNFVGTVLYLESTKEFPNGLVVTGGNDNTIFIYKPHEPFAMLTLKEHSNAVCCLAKGLDPNTFLSSSWDATAKLWALGKPQSALVAFAGHTAAVWAVVQLQNTNVVTASADKTIGVFSKDGFRINTIQGHTDCIRGLADFPELNCFVSVSNDASIKVWTYTGTNLDTYYGHTNYIYSIARNKAGGDNCFVTSDEDRTVRYWKDGVNTETFQLPAQSVWTIACLSNGDIVTGSSDGIVRVFTQDETRQASDEVLHKFEEEVSALAKQSTQEIGGYKVSDLPGKEALFEPGKKPGQMKMVREPQGVVAYTWVEDGESGHWEKVGDVLGGADPNSGNKTTYEGKAYDFVFSVDVEEGKPPLKLPYNKGDDPYMAAHSFLEKNFLPPAYLDQVVDFILKNSQDSSESFTARSDFVDPFTGGSRYTPSSSANASTGSGASGANLDPFTGSSSYSSTQTPIATSQDSQFFPQTQFRGFESGNPNLILGKLKEFNQKAGSRHVDEAALENVIRLSSAPVADVSCFDVLFSLLHWNDEIVFPVIDIVRMALKIESNHKAIVLREKGVIMEKLQYFVSQDCKTPNSTLVSFRALCNMFMHPWGEKLVFEHRVNLLENITGLSIGYNKNIQVALVTFLLNITVLCEKLNDELGFMILTSVIPDIFMQLDDAEARFRGLIAAGTLLATKNADHKKLVHEAFNENVNFVRVLNTIATDKSYQVEVKCRECAKQVLLQISNK